MTIFTWIPLLVVANILAVGMSMLQYASGEQKDGDTLRNFVGANGLLLTGFGCWVAWMVFKNPL